MNWLPSTPVGDSDVGYGGFNGGRVGQSPVTIVPSSHWRWVTVRPGTVVVAVVVSVEVSVEVTVVGAVVVTVVVMVVVTVLVTTDGGAAGGCSSSTGIASSVGSP